MSVPLAVMAYSVLEPALDDLEGTLERVAGLGFAGMETYGIVEHYGAARVRTAMAGAGLLVTSAHMPFPAGADADRLLDDAEEVGAPVLVWSMEREEFDTAADVLRGLERINEAAENAAARGLRIAYHNHFAEFTQIMEGGRAYDLLLANLDPRVVVELDAYWAVMGGADPAEVLRMLGPRAEFVHIKDGPAKSYEDDVMVPIGEGSIDWAAALAAGTGLRWHIVELERLSIDVFEALRRSRDHLIATGMSHAREDAR